MGTHSRGQHQTARRFQPIQFVRDFAAIRKRSPKPERAKSTQPMVGVSKRGEFLLVFLFPEQPRRNSAPTFALKLFQKSSRHSPFAGPVYSSVGECTMRLRLPTSRGSFKLLLSLFDAFWAIISPVLALYFREAQILSYDGLTTPLVYCTLSVLFSLLAFSAFRIHEGMSRYFSVHDAVDVTKAVVVAA